MKATILILVFATFGSSAQAVLEESSLKAVVNPVGKLFGSAGVQFPKNEAKYSFGESVIWLSGISDQDTFVSSNMFGSNISDFQSGPISLDGFNGSTNAKWDKVYSLSKNQSIVHKTNFKQPEYIVPESIEKWQANGEEGFTKLLAPFADWNNNEIYEPTQGDYPYIYGDQMAYTVFNDRGAHGLTGGNGMGVQVENLVSVYGSYGDVATNNVLVNRVLVTNKSSKEYVNFKLSILSDFILGNDKDNFVGTDAQENFIYCYNSGNFDAIYGENIPVLVVFPLNANDTILSSIYMTNDVNALTGIPSNREEFFNYSQGLWKNGKSLAYGGAGLDGATECKFVYSGTTDKSINGSDWNEIKVGNLGGERKMLMNLDLGSIAINEVKKVPIAYAILENYKGNLEDVKSLVKKIRLNHLEGLYTSSSEVGSGISFYPTVAKVGSRINLNFTLDGHSSVSLYDNKGNMVQEIRNSRKNFFILNGGLTSGMYFLKHENVLGIGYTKLFIQ